MPKNTAGKPSAGQLLIGRRVGRGNSAQPAGPKPPDGSALLLAEGIQAGYGDAPVLLDVNFSVKRGEFVALAGPSGSGKSTLLYSLAGIHRPNAGKIFLGNQELTGMSEGELTDLRRRNFGFVLQFGRLIGELSAVENVSLPLRLNGVARRSAEQRAADLLAELGMARMANRAAGTLSGGEQQRAAVARALIHRPSVVFADEPTGALDSKNGELVIGKLIAAAKDRAAALVVVTHDEHIASRADRVERIADGQLASQSVVHLA